MLEIINLEVSCEDKSILRGFSLTVKPGEIHAIMGPNGAGKSTVAKVLAGHPSYEVTGGDIVLDGTSLLELDPEERAHKGLFLGFQYPVEVAGVSTEQFLRSALNAQRKSREETPLSEEEFAQLLNDQMALLNMDPSFKQRSLNEGFSGGEKKRNEILQMAVLNPQVAILDEIDSGLDIDAMKIVASGIQKLHTPNRGLILITHYQRLLNHIKPDCVHVVMNGTIAASGGPELALKLEEEGYDWIC